MESKGARSSVTVLFRASLVAHLGDLLSVLPTPVRALITDYCR
jgi:hypothetical protein